MRYFIALFCTFLVSPAVNAADLCKAIALRDVGALESSDSVIQKGEYDTSITQYNVKKQTGVAVFCSHGGYCYPTHVLTSSGKVEALRLVNCTIDRAHPHDEGDEISYELVVTRSAVPPASLRKSDITDRLHELGMCNACADNAAQWYIQRPQSQCGALARRALEGDPVAAAQLQADPSFCTWSYR